MQAAPPPHENQVRGRDGQWGGENFLDVSLFSFNCLFSTLLLSDGDRLGDKMFEEFGAVRQSGNK